MSNLRAIIHASEILTGEGIRKKQGRHVHDDDLGRIVDGALVYRVRVQDGVEVPDTVEWVGKTSDLPTQFSAVPRQDLALKFAVTPGLIDCHTHLIFAGDRSEEFAARCAGATYAEIAAKGGGIHSTVRATREASAQKLESLAVERLEESYSYGVRTIEIKSGYGLSFESELKILELIPGLRKKFPQMTILSTFLGAHDFPKDRSREEYLSDLTTKILPEVSKRKLADACDVFIDEGFYTLAEGRKILEQARDLGMKIKVHADELANTESAALAAELGALSADHLLRISSDSIKKLAASETVAVLLPSTAFYLKAAHAPARALITAGARVAISTDFNPGTSMTLSLPATLTIAALYLGMSRSELFASVTYNAACALGLQSRKGSLQVGLDADFSILPFPKFEELYYRFAWSSRIK